MNGISNIQINRQQVKDDLKTLKRKGVKSPDHLKMGYSIKVRGRTTYYFSSQKKYLNKYRILRRDYTEYELKVSNPELCMKNCSNSVKA